jgi:hypothetical protein
MSAPRKLRLVASLALLCALFLPLSECRKDAGQPPEQRTLAQRVFPRDNERAKYTYGFDLVSRDWGGVITAASFCWPALLLAAALKWPRIGESWITHLLELAACGGSGWWIGLMASLCGSPLYGAYIAFTASGLYACAALQGLFLDLRGLSAPLRLRPAPIR